MPLKEDSIRMEEGSVREVSSLKSESKKMRRKEARTERSNHEGNAVEIEDCRKGGDG